MAKQKTTQKVPQPESRRQQPGAQPENESRMPLTRRNYMLILIGLATIIVGMALMAGGGSDDPAVFNDKMFSFRRITLAPIVVIAGFAFEIYAIMWRPKTKN